MNYLISYNHSGNSWLRYCIEFLTQLPTHGHRDFSISQRDNNFLNVDLSKPPIVVKRHELDLVELNDNDTLILLTRNPYDAIKEDTDIQQEFEKYYNLILLYENFNGKKYHIKYDNIFNINTIVDIVNFYELKTNKLKELELNFTEHQKYSRNIYQNQMYKNGANLNLYIDKKLIDYVRKYI